MDYTTILTLVLSVIATAQLITKLTPTPRDDIWLGKIYKGVEWIAKSITENKDKNK